MPAPVRNLAAAALVSLIGAHAAGAASGTPAPAGAASAGPVLYVDDQFKPSFSIEWQTTEGETVRLEGQAPYTAPEQRVVLGRNIEAFVAVGGTRLTKSAGHPSGAILRVGFYKADTGELFFDDIREGSSVTVTMTGVRFIRDGVPDPRTTLQHLKYTLADVEECGLSPDAMDQYNTWSVTDTMHGKITPANARLGALDGVPQETPGDADPTEPGAQSDASDEQTGDDPVSEKAAAQREPWPEGRADVWLEDDGAVSLKATIPYALFRHVRDPWMRTDPGGFFEPYHFHVEFEAIPVEVWEAEYEDRPLPRREAEDAGA